MGKIRVRSLLPYRYVVAFLSNGLALCITV
jgi:hypothetical protein